MDRLYGKEYFERYKYGYGYIDSIYHEQYVEKFGSYRLITGPTRGILLYVLRVLLEKIVENGPASKLREFAKKLTNDDFIPSFDDRMLKIIKRVGQSPENCPASYKILKCQQGTGEQGIVSLWYIKNVNHTKELLATNTLCMSDASMKEIFHLLWKRFNSLCAMLDPDRSRIQDLVFGRGDSEILDDLTKLCKELEGYFNDVSIIPSPIEDSFNSPPASPSPPMPGAPKKLRPIRQNETKMNYAAAAKGQSSRSIEKSEESSLVPMDSVVPDDAKEIACPSDRLLDKIEANVANMKKYVAQMNKADAEDLPRLQKKPQTKKAVAKEAKIPKPTSEIAPELECRPFVTVDENGKMVIVNAVFSKEALAKLNMK